MASPGLVDVAVRGSYLCAAYELRITARCLDEDLGSGTEASFEELSGHEIVTAFVNRRKDSPTNTRTVAPLSSGEQVYRLAYGERHRGATWFDEANGVVWLLAYAQHEFEDRGDAFPYFKQLDRDDRLLPTAEDYEALFRDRDLRFTQVVEHEAANLLQAARDAPGTEQRAVIGGQFGVGVAVEVVETLEEVWVAVKTGGLTQEYLAILFAALFPEAEFEDIESVSDFADRELDPDELGFRCLLD
jgi:hypothetical protein